MIVMGMSHKKIVHRILNTYCRLMPSKVHGVGLFAIKDIPKRMNPFKSEPKQRWIKIHMDSFKKADKEVLKLVKDFYWFGEDRIGWVPENGFYGMGLSFYANHSEKPNLKRVNEDGDLHALRKIKKGEELLVDYRSYD